MDVMSKARPRKWIYGAAVVGLSAVVGISAMLVIGPGNSEPDIAFEPGEPVVRRLTADQYSTIIADVFGPTIELGGRFEPELRVDGLLEIGASQVSISPFGMQQYDAMARNIARQVLDEERRNLFLSCQPE